MTTRPFRMIDVFPSATPQSGNPLAVVLDSEALTTAQMAAFSAWTNLSECTFVLPPTDPAADYRVRIFSLTTELPFAGHPTLGTARAWLDAGGVPRTPGRVIQECGVGLVPVRIDDDTLAFAAPPLIRSGPVAGRVAIDRHHQALALVVPQRVLGQPGGSRLCPTVDQQPVEVVGVLTHGVDAVARAEHLLGFVERDVERCADP